MKAQMSNEEMLTYIFIHMYISLETVKSCFHFRFKLVATSFLIDGGPCLIRLLGLGKMCISQIYT